MEGYSKTDPSLIWPDDPAFRNFPKRLPDDCVEYTIHVLDTTLNNNTLRSRLLEIQRAAEKLKKDLLKGYIWQREGFGLALSGGSGVQPAFTIDDSVDDEASNHSDGQEEEDSVPGASKPDPAARDVKPSEIHAPLHLRGQTSYGDSIADEWLIVHLLRTLSQQYPQIWMQVWDSDGQFLLIEAANVLPDWLDPDVSENRIWMHEGRLKIIPLDSNKTIGSKKGRKKTLKLTDALSYLQQHALNLTNPAYSLLDSDSINSEAFNRIRTHPASIPSNLHTTIARIPRKLAYLVNRQPQWVSPAVEAFYLRDPIAMQSLQGKGSLTFPPEDMVNVPVKMQRVGFAQLKGQDFEIPKAWASHKAENPPPGTYDGDAKTEVRRRDIGMKLTCGFEMLLSDPANKDKQIVREINLVLEDLDAGEEDLPSDAELATWHTETKEDSEDWLNIDWASFEKELKGQQDTGKSTVHAASTTRDIGEKASVSIDEGFGDKVAQENLRRMVAKFEGFLKSENENTSGLSEQTVPKTNTGADGTNGNGDGDDKDDDDDDEEDDESFAPSDESDSELGSSEEEGWGTDEVYDDEDEADSEDETNDPEADLTDEKASKDDLTDTDLETIMREMKSIGLSAPPAPRSDKENNELREALLALADVEPDPQFKPSTLPDTTRLGSLPDDSVTATSEGKQNVRARAGTTTTTQPEQTKKKSSSKHERTKSESKGNAPLSPPSKLKAKATAKTNTPHPQNPPSPNPPSPNPPSPNPPTPNPPSSKPNPLGKTRAVDRYQPSLNPSNPDSNPDSNQDPKSNPNPDPDTEAAAIEEMTRNMHDADLDSLSSDSEVDHLEPADVKSFEEVFGRELREAGLLE